MNTRAWVAECVGTFALVFIGVGAIAADHVTNGGSGLVGIALAHGLTIAVMASATGAISGGHLNPAVTIALAAVGKIDRTNAAGYVLAQCLGAILAAAVVRLCLPADALAAVGLGTPALQEGVSVGMGLLIEAVLTFFLMFVVYGTAVDARAPRMAALFIGLTVTLDILLGGPFTGAAMNPARHLGPALLGGIPTQAWLYWVGPVAGALGAALLYRTVFEDR